MDPQRSDTDTSTDALHRDAFLRVASIEEEEHPPLVVDVNGTLLKGDLLWEGLAHLVIRKPRSLPGLLSACRRGKGALKRFVAVESGIAPDGIPISAPVGDLIAAARAQRRKIILTSGAAECQVAMLAESIGADLALGSDDSMNLTGRKKLERIRAHCSSFDYVGSDVADLPIWKEARSAFAVGLNRLTLRRIRRQRPDIILLGTNSSRFRDWVRVLRPHQWAKNALLILPALAAHLSWTPVLAFHFILGLLAFSMVASAVYLFNDVADLPNDRLHPKKRDRAIAGGQISIPLAFQSSLALLIAAAVVAYPLPLTFRAALVTYLVLAVTYSLLLKSYALVDVICLAMLYTIRVVAGAELVGVALSRWFLAFSIFLFLSLALAKRAVELRTTEDAPGTLIPGRGYSTVDLPVLTGLGTSAVGASSLVYCLYITSSDVLQLYRHPDILWAGFPLLLYWQARVWLLTLRGEMLHDPVSYALGDRTSYIVLGLFLLVVWIAS